MTTTNTTALAVSPEIETAQVERMLSFQSAGDLIDKSARTVRRLVDTGRIRAVVFLGSLRIRESEMARFIKDECARNEASPPIDAADASTDLKLVS